MATTLLKMTLTPSSIPAMPGAGLTARIRKAFADSAGAMIVAAIRSHLGQDSTYQLSENYSARKGSMKGLVRYPGKSSDQPLILTGKGIFEALVWTATSDGLTVHVEDGKGLDDGFDYAEWWEEITSYLELGLHDVEDDLPELLVSIIVNEMAL